MITMRFPKADENLYTVVNNFLVGPYRTGWNSSEIPDMVSARGVTDSLSEGRHSFYGEKGVNHQEIKAVVNYDPLIPRFLDTHTSTFPRKITVGLKSTSTGSLTNVDAPSGFYAAGRPGINTVSGSVFNQTFWVGDKYGFRTLEMQATLPLGQATQIIRKTYSVKTVASTGITYNRKTEHCAFLFNDPIKTQNWGLERSLSDILAVEAMVNWVTDSNDLPVGTAYRDDVAYVGNPKVLRDALEMEIWAQIGRSKNTCQLADYGELAMNASAQFKLNTVNMWAFAADIVRPWEMIPKLKNLRNLKSWADDYLSVHFGLLPTVDDLKSIKEVLEFHKPYLDKNGFSTHSASHTDSCVSGIVTHTEEQHLKIAIDKTEISLNSILFGLESIGILPSLENVWDLVPFSFVIDWFVQVGDLLEMLDNYERILRMPVKYVTMSHKHTASFDLKPTSALPLSGPIELVTYDRWTTGYCPLPPSSAPSATPDFSHWLEAGALIIQRKK